ncbi:MAG: YchJ family protein [Alphaproteobacteria bacterium]
MTAQPSASVEACPCGSGHSHGECCGPIIDGEPAPTALALMRARYASFALRRVDDFAFATLAAEKRGDFDRAAVERSAAETESLGFEVRACSGGGVDDDTGTVEYVARFRTRGRSHLHHELATFRREEGRWVYVDGQMNPKPAPRRVVSVGRNDPCPCGSGKKHKKCCGA